MKASAVSVPVPSMTPSALSHIAASVWQEQGDA